MKTDAQPFQHLPSDSINWPAILPDAATLSDWQRQLVGPPKPPPPEPAQLTNAAELCEFCQIKLKPRGAALLRPDDMPQQFYRRLVAEECWADARRVLAHGCPNERAIWWGCLVAADVNQQTPMREIEMVLPVVLRFVVDPTDENRRAAAMTGKLVPVSTLAGALAMATYFSGGSVSLPQLPVVHPRPFVTGRLVGVAVYLASVKRDAARYKDHLRRYLAMGEDVARGRLLWNSDKQIDSVLRYDAMAVDSPLSGPHGSAVAPKQEQQEKVADHTVDSTPLRGD